MPRSPETNAGGAECWRNRGTSWSLQESCRFPAGAGADAGAHGRLAVNPFRLMTVKGEYGTNGPIKPVRAGPGRIGDGGVAVGPGLLARWMMAPRWRWAHGTGGLGPNMRGRSPRGVDPRCPKA